MDALERGAELHLVAADDDPEEVAVDDLAPELLELGDEQAEALVHEANEDPLDGGVEEKGVVVADEPVQAQQQVVRDLVLVVLRLPPPLRHEALQRVEGLAGGGLVSQVVVASAGGALPAHGPESAAGGPGSRAAHVQTAHARDGEALVVGVSAGGG